MRELRADEIYKEQNRIKINKRYAEDSDYRAKKLEKSKERRHAQALLNNKTILSFLLLIINDKKK